MYRKILVGGATAAAIVGVGTAALALSGPSTTTGSPAATVASAQQHGGRGHGGLWGRRGRLLRRVVQGQVVVRGAKGFVTHDVIVGTVSAVSPTSITVHAANGTNETWVVTGATKVRSVTAGSRSASSIGKVAHGDTVAVAGTGTTTLTAKHIIDIHR